MCCLFDRLPDFIELKKEIRDVKSKAESCSKQLKAWAESIQNSEYQGERHVTERLKRSDQAARDREEFLQELMAIKNKHVALQN